MDKWLYLTDIDGFGTLVRPETIHSVVGVTDGAIISFYPLADGSATRDVRIKETSDQVVEFFKSLGITIISHHV